MDSQTADILTSANGYALEPPIQEIDLPGRGTNNQTIALKSPSGHYVWRRYQTHTTPETILYEHRLLTWLAQKPLTFTVPAPLPMQNGETLHQNGQDFSALFPLIAGADPDRRNPAQMESVGAALGELHCTLEAYPQTTRSGLATYSAIEQVHPQIPEPAALTPKAVGLASTEAEATLFAWWRAEVAHLQQWQIANYQALPHQLIHGDYTPANTLVVGNAVSALLDFDFSLLDARAMDVAAGLYFTMRIWENPDPWPVADAFCSGYNQWVQPTQAEVAAIPWLMRLRSVVSTIWWFGKEVAAEQPVKLWRIEDLQRLVTWLDQNEQRLKELLG